ncbi:MAG TPA: hypothetical protein VJ851_13365 [Jatrophihabitans sp.]|nr:hypothetical protein [Jatrophihabitans sp.]
MCSRRDLPSLDRVVVIIASSRSGSSFLFDLLRRSGAFLSLPGEHTPLYRRYRMLDGRSGGSPAADARFRRALRRSARTGEPIEQAEPADRARFILRTLRRQWGFALAGAAQVALTALEAAAGSRPGGRSDYLDDFVAVVTALRAAGIEIDPWYYDLDPVLIRRRFPAVPRPVGPPRRCQELESTPLLVPRAERLPAGAELHRPLLLKATVDAYRIESLLRIFADAQLEFVQLTRNPAASINGLIDGWLSPTFFSCRLPGRPLRIAGYTNEQPWTQSWWNFDLPPHWPELVNSPLAQVCRDQWTAAQAAMRQSLQAHRIRPLRVRAEQLWDPAAGAGELCRIFEQLRLRPARRPEPRVVMATSRPAPARWRQRQQAILPLLATGESAELARWAGYCPESADRWT